METTVISLLIHITEVLILWYYCRRVFPRPERKSRYLAFLLYLHQQLKLVLAYKLADILLDVLAYLRVFALQYVH